MEVGHNGLQAQLRQFAGCGFGEVDVVFSEVVPVNYRIMASARWVAKKWCSNIQEDDVLMAGVLAVTLNLRLDVSDLLVIRPFVLAW